MAMQMIRITNDDFIYLTAPTSHFSQNLHFHTAPTTPKSSSPSVYESSSCFDEFIDFEFESSRRYPPRECEFDRFYEAPFDQKPEKEKTSSVAVDSTALFPAMAFADELFCDGKVMPLKPPPPCTSGGGGGGGVFKSPFSRRWDDDFDPFTVALEKVKGVLVDKHKHTDSKRSLSLSPLRSNKSKSFHYCKSDGPDMGWAESTSPAWARNPISSNHKSKSWRWAGSGLKKVKEKERDSTRSLSLSPFRPSKSKSFHYCKSDGPDLDWVRSTSPAWAKSPNSGRTSYSPGLKRMDPDRPNLDYLYGSSRRIEKEIKRDKLGLEKPNKDGENGESKKQKMKKLLFKSAFSNSDENYKNRLPKKSVECNEKKRVSLPQMAKLSLFQGRPRFFMCLGHKSKNKS